MDDVGISFGAGGGRPTNKESIGCETTRPWERGKTATKIEKCKNSDQKMLGTLLFYQFYVNKFSELSEQHPW